VYWPFFSVHIRRPFPALSLSRAHRQERLEKSVPRKSRDKGRRTIRSRPIGPSFQPPTGCRRRAAL